MDLYSAFRSEATEALELSSIYELRNNGCVDTVDLRFISQCPCSTRKRFSRDHCCRGRSKPGCRTVGSHTRWELTTWANFQLCLQGITYLRQQYVINGLHHMLGTTRFSTWPASLHPVHGRSCRCSWETRCKLTCVRWRYTTVFEVFLWRN